MKVVLLSNYGGRIPKDLISFVTSGQSWRWGNVVQALEQKAVPAEDSNSANAKIVRYMGPDPNTKMYLFRADNISISVVDVDISRKWTIEKYDGAEYIQYLDYRVVNEAMGYCELPKN